MQGINQHQQNQYHMQMQLQQQQQQHAQHGAARAQLPAGQSSLQQSAMAAAQAARQVQASGSGTPQKHLTLPAKSAYVLPKLAEVQNMGQKGCNSLLGCPRCSSQPSMQPRAAQAFQVLGTPQWHFLGNHWHDSVRSSVYAGPISHRGRHGDNHR